MKTVTHSQKIAMVGPAAWRHAEGCECDRERDNGYLSEKCSEIYLRALSEQLSRILRLEAMLKEQFDAGFEAGKAEVWASMI